jgi:L-ascorbate metabolism protein UlaG (beta-lactamase superfamily)
MSDRVKGDRRPASLGGCTCDDADTLTLRWYGTTNFELEFRDRIILLDNFYDRGPRTTPLDFRAADVVRADYILIGHPHFDHISDTATVGARTGAQVFVHGLGADYLVEQGLSAENIERVAGQGKPEVFELDGFRLTVLHGFHMQPASGGTRAVTVDLLLQTARETRDRAAEEEGMPPLTEEEHAELDRLLHRGVWGAEVATQATLCFVLEVAGFRLVYRDSAGPISAEEEAWFTDKGASDLALVAYAGRPFPRQQITLTLPLVQRYKPKIAIPCHHDDIFPYFRHVPTEPLKRAVEDSVPACRMLQPTYVEPIRIDVTTKQLVRL